MDFGSPQKKEKDGWLAAAVGCCASKDDIDDGRDVYRANGTYNALIVTFFLYHGVLVVSLFLPFHFVALFFLSRFDQCVLDHAVELALMRSLIWLNT
jgi:hypothetical protein